MLREMARNRFILVVYKPEGPRIYTNFAEVAHPERMIQLLDTPTEE